MFIGLSAQEDHLGEGPGHETGGDEADGPNPEIYSYAMGIVITAIILVSIIFETMQDKAMEGAKDW